jgi:hypothetical protein
MTVEYECRIQAAHLPKSGRTGSRHDLLSVSLVLIEIRFEILGI